MDKYNWNVSWIIMEWKTPIKIGVRYASFDSMYHEKDVYCIYIQWATSYHRDIYCILPMLVPVFVLLGPSIVCDCHRNDFPVSYLLLHSSHSLFLHSIPLSACIRPQNSPKMLLKSHKQFWPPWQFLLLLFCNSHVTKHHVLVSCHVVSVKSSGFRKYQ